MKTKKKAKHSVGPWTHRRGPELWRESIWNETGRIADLSCEQDREANARLITASVGLLEAAKTARIVAALFGTDDPQGKKELADAVRLLRKQAGDAVRKAEGG